MSIGSFKPHSIHASLCECRPRDVLRNCAPSATFWLLENVYWFVSEISKISRGQLHFRWFTWVWHFSLLFMKILFIQGIRCWLLFILTFRISRSVNSRVWASDSNSAKSFLSFVPIMMKLFRMYMGSWRRLWTIANATTTESYGTFQTLTFSSLFLVFQRH